MLRTLPSLVLLLVACCGYSTRSLLPSHLRSAAIVPADNATVQPGLGEALTDSLTAAFNADRNLRVTNVENADLVVSTKVETYSRSAASYTGEQAVSAYELSLGARVQARDQVRDEDFYSGSVSVRVTYDPNVKTEEQAAQEAIKKLAAEIVRQVLTAW
jgi:hypothetical protein